MAVIDRATTHFNAQEKLVISVPEWGDGNQPLLVHVFPMTMGDVNQMRKLSGKKGSEAEQAAALIVLKAKDEQGNRLFKVTDRERLINECDYRVVSRIAEQIGEYYFGDTEELKGNSNATSTAIAS